MMTRVSLLGLVFIAVQLAVLFGYLSERTRTRLASNVAIFLCIWNWFWAAMFAMMFILVYIGK